MLRILVLLWSKFFLFFSQPVVLILLLVSLIIFAVSFYVFDIPAVGLALKGFFLHTLPKWYGISVKFLVRFTAKSSMKSFLKALASLFAFKSVLHYFELRVRHIRHVIARLFARWKALTPAQKTGWGTLFFCLLWLPLGGWIILFIPMVVVKDALIRIFRYILGKLGLSFAFKKLVNFFYEKVVPRSFRAAWHWRISRQMYAKRRAARRKLQATPVGKTIVKYTKKSGRTLKKKLTNFETEKDSA